MTQTNLSHLHTTVWQFLSRMAEAGHWPTPEPLDALRNAFIASADALNAWLLFKHGSERQKNALLVIHHLSSCATMLMAALPPGVYRQAECDIARNMPPTKFMSLDQICSSVGFLLLQAQHSQTNEILALVAVADIARYPGMNLAYELPKRLEAIEAKHN